MCVGNVTKRDFAKNIILKEKKCFEYANTAYSILYVFAYVMFGDSYYPNYKH